MTSVKLLSVPDGDWVGVFDGDWVGVFDGNWVGDVVGTSEEETKTIFEDSEY